jgi:hypothetical protein
MKVTLDDTVLFDEQGLRIKCGAATRARIERAVCGLDGVVSIDLGKRTRAIRQSGVLHASSRAVMRARIDSICSFIDGQTHTLRTSDGQEFSDVRMDTFTPMREGVAGPGMTLEYEIMYTQLGA